MKMQLIILFNNLVAHSLTNVLCLVNLSAQLPLVFNSFKLGKVFLFVVVRYRHRHRHRGKRMKEDEGGEEKKGEINRLQVTEQTDAERVPL
ncbi:hypothetical protein AQUCO_09500025v1 [Aquilegia coerulea]|uniref:Uncharacterized protein n=1 Tax=Aquilegia coerulea TaxID=218851 RepID=A0A2G5C4P3_AQUCA|nr:hypothetical protein AQUCO_09500025v1 [Aquilegia coerulea]